jgi:hypothetical protein
MKNLNLNRLFLLIKKEYIENIKLVLIGYIAVIGFIFAILLLNSIYDGELWLYFNGIYNSTIVLVGIVFAGISFADFRTKERAISYLTLPATHLEKILSQILLSTFGFVISYTLVFYLSYLMFYVIGKMFFTFPIGGFNPFTLDTYNAISALIIIQSLYLAGASFFKKIPVFFTSLYIFVFSLILLLVVGVLVHLLTNQIPQYVGLQSEDMEFVFNTQGPKNISKDDFWSGKIISIFFHYLLAPIFWLITYFNLKEKEV